MSGYLTFLPHFRPPFFISLGFFFTPPQLPRAWKRLLKRLKVIIFQQNLANCCLFSVKKVCQMSAKLISFWQNVPRKFPRNRPLSINSFSATFVRKFLWISHEISCFSANCLRKSHEISLFLRPTRSPVKRKQ